MATPVLDSVSSESAPCSGFSSDTYDRYVLGLLDQSERAGVESELEQQCPACIAGVQRSINLWLVFAGSLQQVEPAADFRARLIRIADLSNRVLTVPKRYSRVREPAILISSLVVISLILGVLLFFTFLAGKQSARLKFWQEKDIFLKQEKQFAEAEARLQQEYDQDQEKLLHSGSAGSSKPLQDELAKAQAQIQKDQAEIQSYNDSIQRDKQRATDNSTLVSALENPGVRLLTFKTPDGVSSTAYAFVIENSKVVFVASNMDAPADQHQYQLWLVRKTDHQFVSLHVFTAKKEVPAVITYDDKDVVADLAGLIVTEEQMNGSQVPSPTRLLETPGVAALIAAPLPAVTPPPAS